ncbi:hypothetical protein ACWCO9_19545 [Streptomyces sp. NPDC001937]
MTNSTGGTIAETPVSRERAAWRAYIRHTHTCDHCRTGVNCAELGAFKRAWHTAKNAVPA